MIEVIKKLVYIFPLLLVFSTAQAQPQMEMIIEKESPLGFDETIEKLIANAKDLGWKAPKKWRKNFQKNFIKVTDIDIGKALVIEICEPYAAAELMQNEKYKKLLSFMPCTIAVYDKSDGKTYISLMNMRVMGQLFPGQTEIEKMVAELAPQMDEMLDMNRKIEE